MIPVIIVFFNFLLAANIKQSTGDEIVWKHSHHQIILTHQ